LCFKKLFFILFLIFFKLIVLIVCQTQIKFYCQLFGCCYDRWVLKAIVAKNWFIFLFVFILFFGLGLRTYKLDKLPPSPYWEEVALGYDAYSILKTGKDHHGNFLPIVAFESFGDFKPSLYFYVLLPFIKIFGLSVWAVRLPAVLSGVATAIGCSYLVYLLFLKDQGKRTAKFLALVALLLTSINPWLLQFSRSAWEISLATALITWGVVTWILALNRVNKNKQPTSFFVLSGLLFGLSMYAQHSARLIAPLLGIWLVFWSRLFFLPKFKTKTWFAGSLSTGLTALIVILPIVTMFFSNQVQQRFNETSIFTNLSTIEKSNYYRELNDYSLVSRVFYHRYLLFGQEILSNFLTHFNFNYLFLSGDSNPRHSIQFFGLFYPLDLPLLLLGVYYLIRKRRELLWLVGGWLAVATLPASISTGAPHALRTLPGFGAWIVILIFGVMQTWTIWQSLSLRFQAIGSLASVSLILVYLAGFIVFSKYYFQIYPAVYAEHWQFGYQPMIQAVESLRSKYPELPVYITREQGRPAMYFWFYTQTDPKLVQAEETLAKKDRGEFLEWKNIKFIDKPDQVQAGEFILASSPEFLSSVVIISQLKPVKIIAPLGETVWQVGLYQK